MITFLSAMVLTMLLGIQSKNVNQSKYITAAITSICIGLCNLIAVKAMITNDLQQIALYIAGGPVGIILSIYIHDRYLTKK